MFPLCTLLRMERGRGRKRLLGQEDINMRQLGKHKPESDSLKCFIEEPAALPLQPSKLGKPAESNILHLITLKI